MKQGSFQICAGRIEKQFTQLLRRGVKAGVVPETMNRRPGVFSKQAVLKRLIGNRLGWVDSASSMKRKVAGIEAFGRKALADGIRHVVLMGMGGSSLCPELFKLVFFGAVNHRDSLGWLNSAVERKDAHETTTIEIPVKKFFGEYIKEIEEHAVGSYKLRLTLAGRESKG